MEDIKLLIHQHKEFLNKFRNTANEISQIRFETDDDISLLEQILKYRHTLQTKIIKLYQQIEAKKPNNIPNEILILLNENDAIITDIIKLDNENLEYLITYKDKIKTELLELTIKKKAVSNYKMKTISLPRFIDNA